MNETIFTEKYSSCQNEFCQEMFSSPLAFHHKTEANVDTSFSWKSAITH